VTGRATNLTTRGGAIPLVPSPASKLEFCVGTLAEMENGDLYGVI
jgi:hypothetical protein